MGVLLTSKSPGQGYDLQAVFGYREEYFKIGEIAFYISTSTRVLRGSHPNAMLMNLPLCAVEDVLVNGGCSDGAGRWTSQYHHAHASVSSALSRAFLAFSMVDSSDGAGRGVDEERLGGGT